MSDVYEESMEKAREQLPLRVNWIGDTILSIHPSLWKETRDLHEELLDLCVNTVNQQNILTDPIQDIRILAEQLSQLDVDRIISLDRKMGCFRDLFPRASGPSLHYSRLRDLTTPAWTPVDLVRPDEIQYARLWAHGIHPNEKVLILDDVSFGAGTTVGAKEDLGIGSNVLYGFLLASTRAQEILGKDRVFNSRLLDFGGNPRDDAWHGADYCLPTNGHYDVREGLTKMKEVVREQIEGGVNQQKVLHELRLPDKMANPPLWVSPYFQEHLDMPRVYNNLEKIFGPRGILQRMAELRAMSFGKENEINRVMRDAIGGRYGSVQDVIRDYLR